MNFDELKSRPIEELKLLAAQYSLKPHPRAKAETIAKMIVEHIATPKAPEPLKHEATRIVKPLVVHTQEQVDEAIATYANRPGFIAQYPGDDTWIFKCNGSEESGHMSTSLRNTRMKAESVSRGARKPRVMKFDGDLILSA